MIKTALIQINSTVGDVEGNADIIIRHARDAHEAGARLIVFPELAISGYPPEDLILKPHFIDDCMAQARRAAAACPADAVTVFGTPWRDRRHVFNTAAVCAGGDIAGCYRKMTLPNYGVFDEKRVFTQGNIPAVIESGPLRLGIHVCEDSWFADGPACKTLSACRLDALINISASPFHRRKILERERILAATAKALRAPVLYCNLIGGQDELVFDGACMAMTAAGQTIGRCGVFNEDRLLVDVPIRNGKEPVPDGMQRIVIHPPLAEIDEPSAELNAHRLDFLPDYLDEIYAALRMGLRDYVRKNGFEKVIVAVSGGIDSALVAALAVDALGAEHVYGITMPSPYTSDGTLRDAHALCERLGIRLHHVEIKRLFQTYLEELDPLWPERERDVTEENMQARIRGNVVMALSNKFGWLVLSTGNKSELATGYCTLYGDMAGGFAVIKDVPKTLVYELSKWRNAQAGAPFIPPSIIERPPSAELRENQRDEDSLPPYDELDGILERYVERDMSIDAIVRDGYDADTVVRVARLVDRNEYKRRQGAPGIKITPKAFGRDRRMPITNRYAPRHNAAEKRTL